MPEYKINWNDLGDENSAGNAIEAVVRYLNARSNYDNDFKVILSLLCVEESE